MVRVSRDLALRLLVLVLKPAVRFCIQHSLRLQDLIECAKVAFIDVAGTELESLGKKANASRISVMTGVHRPDVVRLEGRTIEESAYPPDLVSKVMALWQTDDRFLRADGTPRVLTIEGPESEFARLVQAVSTSVNPASVLFELERVEAIRHGRSGISLEKWSYTPKGDAVAGFQILSTDCQDLSSAVEENVLQSPEIPNLHARTQYDNVRPEGIEALKRWFLREGHKFHLKAREIISQHDQDVNPSPKFKGKGLRVVVGAFSYVSKK